MELDPSPFFETGDPIIIQSIKELIELSKEKTYYAPGVLVRENKPANNLSFPQVTIPHSTTGLFRGQNQNWPLIPSAFRNIKHQQKESPTFQYIKFDYSISLYPFRKFAEIASKHNVAFPDSIFKQMAIAQHYGIKTPLLDWTSNVFVAVFFALDLKGEHDENKNLSPFIYHIIDERLLATEPAKGKEFESFDESAWIGPVPIDRRSERQFSSFTYHPHPLMKPNKIPLKTYRISEDLFMELWGILKGFGFSSFYFFPDYAGIADKLNQNYLL